MSCFIGDIDSIEITEVTSSQKLDGSTSVDFMCKADLKLNGSKVGTVQGDFAANSVMMHVPSLYEAAVIFLRCLEEDYKVGAFFSQELYRKIIASSKPEDVKKAGERYIDNPPLRGLFSDFFEEPEGYYSNNKYEAIDVINDYNLNFNLGNVVKYVLRAGKKTESPIEDLKKAKDYIEYEIKRHEL